VIARLVGDLDRVPTRLRHVAVVTLAPHIGNQRVAQAIAGPPVVQRQGPFGMQKADQVGGFAGDVDAFARANPTKTLADLCGFMMDKVNARLAVNGVPKLPVPNLNSLRSAGGFAASSWTVQFDVVRTATKPLTATVADVPPERLNELAGIFYHEGRHAEQAFLVARYVAGQPGGPKDAKKLSAELDLHEPTAAAALSATTPMPTDKAALETIAGWRAYDKGGKHHDYWEWNEDLQKFVGNTFRTIPDPRPAGVGSIRTQMTTLAPTFADWRKSTMPFADTKLASIKAVKRPDATDAQVRKDLTNTRRLMRKVMDAEAATNKQLGKVDARLGQPKRMTTQEAELFRLNVDAAFGGVTLALAELVVATSNAYEAYAHEADAYTTQRSVQKALAAKQKVKPKRP
jgi:hypothetical protein